MYDLEIAIPFTTSNSKYLSRFNDFLKYGILNVSGKILVSFIGSKKDCEELAIKPKIKGTKSRLVITNSSSVSAKTYEYYYQLMKGEHKARWYMRVDDDSSTDIGYLLSILDSDFDWKQNWYIASWLNKNMEPTEHRLLTEFGYGKWLHPNSVINHEWECAIVSNPVIKTMSNNSTALNIIKERSKYEVGSNDVCFGCAANICGIYAIDAYFLTKESLIHEYHPCGGSLAHIHFLARDIDKEQYELFLRRINGILNVQESIAGKSFHFRRKHGDTETPLGRLHFNDNGTIKGSHPNESMWEIIDNMLYVYSDTGRVTTKYSFIDDDNLEGTFLPQPYIRHHLKKAK